MTFMKKVSLLLLSIFMQKNLLCSKTKTLYDIVLQNDIILAKQLLESEAPPEQAVINDSLVYASGCISILRSEIDNPWGMEQAEMVEMLLKHGADPNYANIHVCNRTPLQMAASKGRLATVKTLLLYGADTSIGLGQKQDALTEAYSQRHINVITELLQRGALITAQHVDLDISDEQVALSHRRSQAILNLLRYPINLPDALIRLILTLDGSSSLWPHITSSTSS